MIAEFAGDLLIDPSTRGTRDVSHTVAAVASSSSKDKAEQFIAKLNIPSCCAAYGSYDELFKDQNVDIVYVATPHSHHYRNVMMALEGGKHVVCEKPLTVNAAQAKKLYEKAKEKNLFLLDAVWTRYFPLSVQIRDIIRKGEIGEVLRVVADLSEGNDLDEWWGVKKHRKFQMDLAGGALLEGEFKVLGEAWLEVTYGSWHLFYYLDFSDIVPYASKGAATTAVKNIIDYRNIQ